jgi:xanthine dehydrogenase small subunit
MGEMGEMGEDAAPGREGLMKGRMVYRPVTSCLTALGNVHQKHIVTIEGLNGEGLNFLQQVIGEEGGTQCGFCTPGFIVSMAGFCLSVEMPTQANALAAVDGNICRCTGYKSIERALARVVEFFGAVGGEDVDRVGFAIKNGIVPAWFAEIPGRLAAMRLQSNGVLQAGKGGHKEEERGLQRGARFLGGGTDLYVQQHEAMVEADLDFLVMKGEMKGIFAVGGICVIGGAATVSDMIASPVIRRAFPHFDEYAKLISSTPIRNIATVAGNFVNASPIGDLSIFFLALDARLTLSDGVRRRELPLRKFYRGYKLLDKEPDEYIERISFDLPGWDMLFHFEKVSKRTNLDIASVNTAILVRMSEGRIVEGHISAGGVGPVPAWLEGASAVMGGRKPDVELLEEVMERAQAEISPISDARGTETYKRLLLGQLIKAHFLTLFPELPVEEVL